MAFALVGESNYNYLHAELMKLQNQEPEEPQENCDQTENRACSSLCELSDNICIDQARNESKIYFNYKPTVEKVEIGLSPWQVQNTQNGVSSLLQKQSLFCKSSALSMIQRRILQRCRTDNKQNIEQTKINSQYSQKLTKINSIYFKKVEPRERKVTSKTEQPQIELLALMCRKNKYSMQISEACVFKQKKGNITQPLMNKSFTPKILNLCHTEQQNDRENEKKLSKNMVGGWSEEIKEQLKNITLANEHWRTKSFQPKSKKSKRIVLIRDSKSTEAKEVRENVLSNKRVSLSVGRQRRGEYKSNNPLTRLLYQKYLHTIGVSQPPKDFRNKY